jgi:hypothetical protein
MLAGASAGLSCHSNNAGTVPDAAVDSPGMLAADSGPRRDATGGADVQDASVSGGPKETGSDLAWMDDRGDTANAGDAPPVATTDVGPVDAAVDRDPGRDTFVPVDADAWTNSEHFTCATSMFSLKDPGGSTAAPLQAYVLTVTATDGRYTGELRLFAPHSEDRGAVTPQVVTLTGRAGPSEIALVFASGEFRATPVPGSARGVFEGSARFAQPTFGALGLLDQVAAACWLDSSVPRFRYNPTSGQCTDDDGVTGRQVVPLPMLRETKNGECATVSSNGPPGSLPVLNGALLLNELDAGYPKLSGWNLRGAVLSGTGINFALLLDADLRGTSLSGFFAGYHNITASVDEHTTGLDTLACPKGAVTNGRLVCCTVGGSCQ